MLNRAGLCSLAILALWPWAPAGPLVAVPAFAKQPAPRAASIAVDMKALVQHWVHSSEEERPDERVRIFRPSGSMAFPPSRFRMAYKFAPDGGCEFRVLAPDDAHHFERCAWSVLADDGAILQIVTNGAATSYRILDLSENILRLTAVEPVSRPVVR